MQRGIGVMPSNTPRKETSLLTASQPHHRPLASDPADGSKVEIQATMLTGIGQHMDSNSNKAPTGHRITAGTGHTTRLQDLQGMKDLGLAVDPEPTPRDVAHRRSFFCRTSSSTYSVHHDQDEAVQWCQYDNAMYGDMGAMPPPP
jgi:hypothetical protein